MAKAAGRDQREPMERLVRLARVLHHAGKVGVETPTLLMVAGFEGRKDGASQLAREFRQMRTLGWQIDNIGGSGELGRYRMTTVDNRLRLRLTPAQQTALRRAVLLADRDGLVERLGLPDSERPADLSAAVPTGPADPALAAVMRAVRLRCILRYRYSGVDRVVHPDSVRTQHGTWYLLGHENGSDLAKWFVVSRMQDVRSDPPGTATPTPTTRHTGLHPMTWEIDEPTEVTLRASDEFAPDVRRSLGPPHSETATDGVVEMVYRVTHRAALRHRLCELGPRVELVGPEDVRRELLDELAEMAGE